MNFRDLSNRRTELLKRAGVLSAGLGFLGRQAMKMPGRVYRAIPGGRANKILGTGAIFSGIPAMASEGAAKAKKYRIGFDPAVQAASMRRVG